jgi:hypothetical protein
MQNIGFWKGLGMAWTSLVMTIVMALRATETTANAVLTVAESGHEATKVLKANVVAWSANDEELKKLNLVA